MQELILCADSKNQPDLHLRWLADSPGLRMPTFIAAQQLISKLLVSDCFRMTSLWDIDLLNISLHLTQLYYFGTVVLYFGKVS